MPKYGEIYQTACNMQKLLVLDVQKGNPEFVDRPRCVRAWLDLEWFKREVRGIPRMKAADKLATLRPVKLPRQLAEPVEIETTPSNPDNPQGISSSPTVPTPPSPEPPGDGSE